MVAMGLEYLGFVLFIFFKLFKPVFVGGVACYCLGCFFVVEFLGGCVLGCIGFGWVFVYCLGFF